MFCIYLRSSASSADEFLLLEFAIDHLEEFLPVQRLFAGTPWDLPPTCERCGKPEAECACPPPPPVRLDPASQTARLRVEKRAKEKVVTVVANLDPDGNDLPALAATLKDRCGTGGTVKDGCIELQGDKVDAAESALKTIGYKTRRG
jgi:translation initiation factor 1